MPAFLIIVTVCSARSVSLTIFGIHSVVLIFSTQSLMNKFLESIFAFSVSLFIRLVPLSLVAFTHSFAQVPTYQSSLDIFKKGWDLLEDGLFEKAHDKFLQVNPNDTAYFDAVSLALQSAQAQLRYDTVISLSRNALALQKYNPLKQEFINSLGFALIQREKYDEAAAVLDSGLREFPRNYLFHFNRSTIHYVKGQHNAAMEDLQNCIRFNPAFYAAHLQLGTLCYEAGLLSKAALALNMALFLNATTDASLGIVNSLEQVYSGNPADSSISLQFREVEDYSEVDEQIRTKVALSPKYKLKSLINYDFIKHNHLLFNSLEYDAGSRGFWNQHYLRFFTQLIKDEQFANFSYYQCVSIDNAVVQNVISKNEAKIKECANYGVFLFYTFMNDRHLWENGKYIQNRLVHNGDYGFDKGVENVNGLQVGPYVGYTANGLVKTVGVLNDEGLMHGVWKEYNNKGVLETAASFAEGVMEGKRTTYYQNGAKSASMTIQNGFVSGEMVQFYNCNQAYSKANYNAEGLKSGPAQLFYATGQVSAKMSYVNDLLEGEYTEYHSNGALKAKFNLDAGVITGDYESYHRNGQQESKGQFLLGEKTGTWINFHDNGQLLSQGECKGGLQVGLWKTLTKDGKIETETDYGLTGTKTGIYKEFDADEHLTLELVYKGEDILSYRTFDKTGKVLSEDTKTQKELTYVGYHPNGVMGATGNYYKSNKTGAWQYFNQFGVLERDFRYAENGKLNGITTFYFATGEIELTQQYSDDQADGYVVEYHKNGNIFREGFNLNGQAVGEWKYYYANGALSSTRYYLENELHGELASYDKIGRVFEIADYFYGNFAGIRTYDTNGVLMNTYRLVDGTADLNYTDMNGKRSRSVIYSGGKLNGESNSYYPDGTLSIKGQYTDDKMDGEWFWYAEDGIVICSGRYDYGEREGTWKWFHDSGVLKISADYRDGQPNGPEKRYYRDGKLELERTVRNGEFHGTSTYYDPSGEIQLLRYYENGIQLGYSFLGKDGKPVAMIPFTSSTRTIEAKFKSGVVSFYGEFQNGYDHGKIIFYHSNGKLSQEYHFENDQPHGKQISWSSTGKPILEENFVEGYQEGETREFYPDGTVKHVVPFVLGEKNGWASKYAPDGKLIGRKRYYNGREIATEKAQ